MQSKGWSSTTLGALIDADRAMLQTGPFGSQLHSYDYVADGVPVVPTEAIGHRRLKSDAVPHVSREKAAELSRHRLAPGDILFARRGVQATGYSALVEPQHDGWLCGTGAILLRFKADDIDPRYVSFYLADSGTIEWLRAHAVGAVMPNLNESVLRSLSISLPPPTTQGRIAEILGTLDDKIELNRRMNETLEGMARALFKSWFIDFDPVRAKLDGRPTGLDPATAALFPVHFEHTDLGLIPKCWAVRPVGEVVRAVGGATPSTSEPSYWEDGKHHWATPKDLSSLSAPVLLDTERQITDAGLEKISSGLLPRGTLLLSSRAPVGYLAIATGPVAVNQGFIAMVCEGDVSSYYMLNWCRENMDEIERRASGTTFQEISKANFRPIPMVVPPKRLCAAFDQRVTPAMLRIEANLRESASLANLRDAILPKLLSGELRVDAGEPLLREVRF